MSKFFNERKNKKKMFLQMHEEVVRLYLRVSIRVKLVLLWRKEKKKRNEKILCLSIFKTRV